MLRNRWPRFPELRTDAEQEPYRLVSLTKVRLLSGRRSLRRHHAASGARTQRSACGRARLPSRPGRSARRPRRVSLPTPAVAMLLVQRLAAPIPRRMKRLDVPAMCRGSRATIPCVRPPTCGPSLKSSSGISGGSVSRKQMPRCHAARGRGACAGASWPKLTMGTAPRRTARCRTPRCPADSAPGAGRVAAASAPGTLPRCR